MQATLEPQIDSQLVPNQIVSTQLEVETDSVTNKRFSQNSLNNLKPRFVKGVSGNPNGRPKRYGELKDKLLEDFAKSPQRAIRRLYDERIDLYFAYAFGKPADRVELSGPDGGAIEVQTTSQVQLIAQLSERGVVLPGME